LNHTTNHQEDGSQFQSLKTANCSVARASALENVKQLPEPDILEPLETTVLTSSSSMIQKMLRTLMLVTMRSGW
jgi:hypothetical protein